MGEPARPAVVVPGPERRILDVDLDRAAKTRCRDALSLLVGRPAPGRHRLPIVPKSNGVD